MKKYAVVVVVLIGLALSSCSIYSCPTYAKKEKVPEYTSKKIRI